MLIERALFNIFASILLMTGLSFWQPTLKSVYDFPSYMKIPFRLLYGIGTIITLKAVADMEKYSDISGLRFMLKVIRSKEISYKEIYEPKDEGEIHVTRLYTLCRHPQQAGTLLLLFFAGTRYSLDRVLFNSFMLAGIIIGVMQEERKLESLFPSYIQYKRLVKNRFIPNIFNIFKKIQIKND